MGALHEEVTSAVVGMRAQVYAQEGIKPDQARLTPEQLEDGAGAEEVILPDQQRLNSAGAQLKAYEGFQLDQLRLPFAGEQLEAEGALEDVRVLPDQQHLCAGAQLNVQEGVKPDQLPVTPE